MISKFELLILKTASFRIFLEISNMEKYRINYQFTNKFTKMLSFYQKKLHSKISFILQKLFNFKNYLFIFKSNIKNYRFEPIEIFFNINSKLQKLRSILNFMKILFSSIIFQLNCQTHYRYQISNISHKRQAFSLYLFSK